MHADKLHVLNDIPPALEITSSLRKLMNKLKGTYMTNDGKGVDYSALRGSVMFQTYLLLTQQLRTVDLNTLAEDEKKAFFLNVYNALTIHAIALSDTIPQSVLDLGNFWETATYNIGGYGLSLDDIEHGILRRNATHPVKKKIQFSPDDPRVELVIKHPDPRIHFALVCGGKSCPAISVYSAENLDEALKTAAKSYCQQEVNVDKEKKQVTMSKMFQWYISDFAHTPQDLVRWVLPYLGSDQQDAASVLVSDPSLQVIYSDYNWQLNKI
ncbi:uncharacterized protein LOC136746929 [Amia ocellicauda]|uniref:uncharacterized protein LOC136746929 n=1 Tax=Amia ocellicauda TaxID=2972642 RepID=UPI003463F32E